jgi:Glycosyl transferases group 1
MSSLNRASALRIGFLTDQDVGTPVAASGSMQSSYQAIVRNSTNVKLLFAGGPPAAPKGRLHRRFDRLKTRLNPKAAYDTEIEQARQTASRARALVQPRSFDAIISPFSGRCLFEASFPCPVIYASDATAKLMADSVYFEYFSEGFRRACVDLEADFSARVYAAAFSSHATLKSAITDFRYPQARSVVVPIGANLTPPDDWKESPSAPSASDVSLLLIAADVARKRLDLCVATMEILRRKGINAKLHLVGGDPGRFRKSVGFSYHGFIDRTRADEKRRLTDLLTNSHVLLLPSIAEMFGIAPAEAAHFARPSLVSDVGGLPTVVQDGTTGFVLQASAGPDAYAEKVLWWIANPEEYERMRRAAQRRAHQELNWDAWAARVLGLIDPDAPNAG